jgi:hypothetical protein
MHKSNLAKRNHIAHKSILVSAAALGQHFGLPNEIVIGLSVQEKDVEIRALKEREAVAALLSGICEALEILPAESDQPSGEQEGTAPADENENAETEEQAPVGEAVEVTGGAETDNLPAPVIDPSEEDSAEG